MVRHPGEFQMLAERLKHWLVGDSSWFASRMRTQSRTVDINVWNGLPILGRHGGSDHYQRKHLQAGAVALRASKGRGERRSTAFLAGLGSFNGGFEHSSGMQNATRTVPIDSNFGENGRARRKVVNLQGFQELGLHGLSGLLSRNGAQARGEQVNCECSGLDGMPHCPVHSLCHWQPMPFCPFCLRPRSDQDAGQ